MPRGQKQDSQFGSVELGRMFRVTSRQLQYWAETDLVRPEIVGHDRVYSSDQAAVVGMIALFARKAVTTPRLRQALRGSVPSTGKRLQEVMRGGTAPVAILTAENHIEICRGQRALTARVLATAGAIVAVDLDEVRAALQPAD
jgi:DNA-binding transcriptional MerR regulator